MYWLISFFQCPCKFYLSHKCIYIYTHTQTSLFCSYLLIYFISQVWFWNFCFSLSITYWQLRELRWCMKNWSRRDVWTYGLLFSRVFLRKAIAFRKLCGIYQTLTPSSQNKSTPKIILSSQIIVLLEYNYYSCDTK
jgi:hypothetical protein